ncbi:MAG: hypothetical protein Q8M76_15860 [Spirochaetaceae bacterium]|nr:hypothetical protein [Spirochaetaceae bacterium]
MDEIGKRRLATTATALAGIVYFLAFAQSLPKELVIVPAWARSVARAPTSPRSSERGGGAAIPFRTAGRFGYFRTDGEILFAAPEPYGLALERREWAEYEKDSESFSIRAATGETSATARIAGYPFFAGERRFVLGPDQASVSELGRNGDVVWSHQFSSIVTAFCGGPRMAVFGLLDGELIGIDPSGEGLLSFSPGGSRIPVILGSAANADASLVAAVSGIDRQRLVVLEKRSTDYRVLYHRWLDSDFRRPISLSFTADGRRLVYESNEGISIWDVDTNSESSIEARYRAGAGSTARRGKLIVLQTGREDDVRLLCAALPDMRIVDAALPDGAALAAVEDDSIYICVGGDILRCDLEER